MFPDTAGQIRDLQRRNAVLEDRLMKAENNLRDIRGIFEECVPPRLPQWPDLKRIYDAFELHPEKVEKYDQHRKWVEENRQKEIRRKEDYAAYLSDSGFRKRLSLFDPD